jgi:hypothetical protein
MCRCRYTYRYMYQHSYGPCTRYRNEYRHFSIKRYRDRHTFLGDGLGSGREDAAEVLHNERGLRQQQILLRTLSAPSHNPFYLSISLSLSFSLSAASSYTVIKYIP